MHPRTSLLVCLLLTVAAMPLASAEAPPAETTTSLGQAIVGFGPGMLPTAQALDGLPVLRTVPDGDFLVLQAPTVEAAAAAVSHLPGVLYVEDDVPMTTLATPNDPRYPNSGQYGPRMMGFPDAWDDVGYGSSDVLVAVLDTGIRRTHEDFTSSRILTGHDYVNGDGDPADDCEHGTHVSGTIAATTDNGRGVAGMSQATILPYKVLGPVGGLFTVTCSGSTSGIAAAIHDARTSGADIVSMSIGGGSSTTMQNAVDQAWNAGLLLVAAAGNDGSSNSVDYPAAYSNVIAVAALDSSGGRASYSDMGSQVEIAAPGSNVESTSDRSDTAYATMSGTSMATPHVAGALALALSCDPSLTNSRLRTKMQATAQDLGASGRDASYGFGLLRIDALITDVGSCSGGSSNQAPTAAFTTTTSGLTVSFDATSSSDPDGDNLTFSWDFGDGTTGSGSDPSHKYSAYGTYTARLTASDGNGGSDSDSATIVLTDPNDPDPSTPNLQNGVQTTYTLTSGQWTHKKVQVPSGATSLSVTMTGPGCGLTGCSLDGDLYVRQGAKPTTNSYDCRPYQSGNAESCSIANPLGWYYVSVHAYSGSGQVQVTATHDAPGSTNNPPTASFTTSQSGLTLNADGTGSTDPDGDTLSYAWSFGDGSTSTASKPSHTYSAYGTYTVSLTVSDSNGGSGSTSKSITFVDPNHAPTASFTHAVSDKTVSFDGTASSDPDGDALSYTWTFGDGVTSNASQPVHTYSAYGQYTATLEVDDGKGKTGTASVTLTLTDPNDPDPSTPNLRSGRATTYQVTAGQWTHMKIQAPAGSSQLQVAMTGPACGLLSCSQDTDLYVLQGAEPTTSTYDCRPYQTGNDESCTLANPQGWYYVSAYGYTGSGSVTITATVH